MNMLRIEKIFEEAISEKFLTWRNKSTACL